MRPRLPVVSGMEAARALERVGFEQMRQRGSHLELRRGDGRIVIVSLHRELAAGTLRSVLRQAGLGVEEFVRLL